MTENEVDDLIDKWHNSGDEETRSLQEFLGWTEEEYSQYITDCTIPNK